MKVWQLHFEKEGLESCVILQEFKENEAHSKSASYDLTQKGNTFDRSSPCSRLCSLAVFGGVAGRVKCITPSTISPAAFEACFRDEVPFIFELSDRWNSWSGGLSNRTFHSANESGFIVDGGINKIDDRFQTSKIQSHWVKDLREAIYYTQRSKNSH